ncbi:MAG: addiction module protein [Hyphomicrobiaceae bacterium]|nr:addiction module protein [Hyphomicrobiaceae bacterium]
MKPDLKIIAQSAGQLQPSDRVKLVEGLLNSLDRIDPTLDAEWTVECADCLAAFERGELSARPARKVLEKHLKG